MPYASSTVLVVVLSALPLFTQNLEWVTHIRGSGREEVYGVSVDSVGCVYVTGTTNSRLDGALPVGDFDAFAAKYDGSGRRIWTTLIGSTNTDIARGIARDPDGNLYITGETTGGIGGHVNAGDSDIFVVKLNASGVVQWVDQLGSSRTDVGRGIAWSSDGGVVVVGCTHSALDGVAGFGGIDGFVMQYSSDGVRRWLRQFGSSSADEGWSVATDGTGNIYLTGYTAADSEIDGRIERTGNDIIVRSYNPHGDLRWVRQYRSRFYESWNVDDRGYGIGVDASGNVYVTGHTEGGLEPGVRPGGDNTRFLMKLDPVGSIVWVRQSGIGGSAVTVDPIGACYTVGGGMNKYSTDGFISWSTPRLGVHTAVAVDAVGAVFTGGYGSDAIYGLPVWGDRDAYIAKYNQIPPPTVNLAVVSAPPILLAPATLTLEAQVFDSSSAVLSVSFYSGATVLYTVSGSPYRYTWRDVAPGVYQLAARARSLSNAVGVSWPVEVVVNPPRDLYVVCGARGWIERGGSGLIVAMLPREAGTVQLRIYDLRGRQVFATERQVPDAYEPVTVTWDGRTGGAFVSAGVYVVRVTGAGIDAKQKIVVR